MQTFFFFLSHSSVAVYFEPSGTIFSISDVQILHVTLASKESRLESWSRQK